MGNLLLDRLEGINYELKRKRQKLCPKRCVDTTTYWTTALDVAKGEISRNLIRREISVGNFNEFGGKEEKWAQTGEAQRLLTEYEVLKLKQAKLENQLDRLLSTANNLDGTLAVHRHSYLELFVSRTGPRDSDEQSCFRRDVVKAYNASNPDPNSEESLWCPILGKWMLAPFITASHIFGFKHGQLTMDAIFGKTETPELFNAKNGLLINRGIEAKFESGLFAIVPDLPEDPTVDQISQWQNSDPKEYKLRIIGRDPAKMNLKVPGLGDDGMTWASFDGRRLQFRSNFRPRDRYLYYFYCLQILRFVFKERYQGEILREQELGRSFWGSPEKYVKGNMLCSFMEEVGHIYDNLFGGTLDSAGSESEKGEDDDLLLLAIARDIDLSNGTTRVPSEEKDSDEELEEDYGDDESEVDI